MVKTKRRLRLYFASPLFNESERWFCLEKAKILRAKGYRVFLPVELSVIAADADITARKKAYIDDLKAIMACDVMLCNLNGIEGDSGTENELGMGALMYEQKISFGIKNQSRILCKPLCYKDDIRSYYKNEVVNNFSLGCAEFKVYKSLEETLPILEKLQEEITEEEGSVKYGIIPYDYEGDIQPTKTLEEITVAKSASDIEKSLNECK